MKPRNLIFFLKALIAASDVSTPDLMWSILAVTSSFILFRMSVGTHRCLLGLISSELKIS